MDVEFSAEAKDKRLNRRVAITVVALSVFMGFCNIKDGNIVQAMQQAQSDSIDTWNQYQATRTKLHIAETSRAQLGFLGAGRPEAAPLIAGLDRDIAKYKAEAPALAAKAQAFSDTYDALNIHDDQFDASEAAVATAISVAAVASLVEGPWVLAVAWIFGAFGIFMGLAGFLGWTVHPDLLSSLLG
jgi:hypothetical protein